MDLIAALLSLIVISGLASKAFQSNETAQIVETFCEDIPKIEYELESQGWRVDESEEVKVSCLGLHENLIPHPHYPLVFHLAQHQLLQAIADLMMEWKRFRVLVLFDQSSGVNPKKHTKIFERNNINPDFVSVSDWAIDVLPIIFNKSENLIILCNEQTTETLLTEINNLNLFDTVFTWLVSGYEPPEQFQFLKLRPQTSLTFLQFQFTSHEKNLIAPKINFNKSATSLNISNVNFRAKAVTLHLSHSQRLAFAQKRASNFSLFDVFFGYHKNKTEVIQFGTWSSVNGLQIFEILKPEDRAFGLRGKLIRSTVFEHLPYSILKRSNNNRTLEVDGYMKDIYDMLTTTLNLKYVIKEVPPVYGIGINGTYTGFVGSLYRKEAETSFNVLAYTNSRRTGVRYTGPLTRGFLAICYNRPKAFVPPTTYWIPFEWDVWLTTFFTLIVLVTALGFGVITSPGSYRMLTPSKILHSSSYRILSGSFFEEALEDPPGLPSKIFYGSLLWATMMVFNHYTSVFTSFLTLLEIKIPFESLEDVINTKDYRIIYVSNTRHQDMFQNADGGLYARVWAKLVSASDSVSDFGSGLLRMYQGKYVYLTEGPTTLSLAANNCSVSFASKSYMHEFFFLTTRNDFPYAKLFNMMLLKVMESGIMNRLASVYNTQKRPPCVMETSSESLGLEQAVGLYIVFAIGIGLAFLALIIERVIAFRHKYLRTKHAQITLKKHAHLHKAYVTKPDQY